MTHEMEITKSRYEIIWENHNCPITTMSIYKPYTEHIKDEFMAIDENKIKYYCNKETGALFSVRNIDGETHISLTINDDGSDENEEVFTKIFGFLFKDVKAYLKTWRHEEDYAKQFYGVDDECFTCGGGGCVHCQPKDFISGYRY